MSRDILSGNLSVKLFDGNHKPFQQFHIDNTLRRRKIPQRLTQFVLVPGTPMIPSRHPGVDDTPHPNRSMSPDHIELIGLGESTVKNLLKTKKRACPRVLFLLSGQEGKEYDAHSLKTYMPQLAAERQFPIEFHIAAHSNERSIGSIDPNTRMPAEVYAEMIDMMFELHDPNDSAKFKTRSLRFYFCSCNTAYVDIKQNARGNHLQQAILQDSFIGRFHKKFRELGYTNFEVVGYRGYFRMLNSYKGAVVTSKLFGNCVQMPASCAEITITATGQVKLPRRDSGVDFHVDLQQPIAAEANFRK